MTNTYTEIGNQIQIIKVITNKKGKPLRVKYRDVRGKKETHTYEVRKNHQPINLLELIPDNYYYMFSTNLSQNPDTNNFIWTHCYEISKAQALLLLECTEFQERQGRPHMTPINEDLLGLLIDYGKQIQTYFEALWIINKEEPTPFKVLLELLKEGTHPLVKIQRKNKKLGIEF